jgi:peptidoglycan/LPS O-acetylase OafA/YrhL
MTKLESVYFDLTRVVAAFFVLVGHVTLLMPRALPVSDWGHYAVIWFFVLSGYVISYVSDSKEKSGTEYFVSRVARVYSVALPAAFLTLLCDFVGRHASGQAIYLSIPHDWPLLRIATGLTFTSETWFASILLLSDGPFWSLCYEVAYYAIFGAAYYLRGWRRVFAVAVLAMLAGPKILLLFPIWLLGAALYHYKRVLSLAGAGLVFGLTLFGLVAFVHSGIPETIIAGTSNLLGARLFTLLEFSGRFPVDYIVALLVAGNYLAVRSFDGKLRLNPRLAKAIRWGGAGTFSLYLFHRPVILMLSSIFSPSPTTQNACLLILSTVAFTVLLSYATERRKLLWRGFAMAIVLRIRMLRRSSTPRPFFPDSRHDQPEDMALETASHDG